MADILLLLLPSAKTAIRCCRVEVERGETVVDSSRTTLFTSDGYRVDYFPPTGPQNAMAITFSERTNTTLDGYGFGNGFMLSRGCGLIAVKTIRNNWYQDLPQEALIAIEDFLNRSGLSGLPRTTYGSSMGAYGALAFSKALEAKAVFAISPVIDLLLPGETRWRMDLGDTFRSVTQIGLLPHTRIVIAFDPFDPDARQADAIEQIAPGQVETIRVPFAGHPVGPALSEAGCLKDLATSVLLDEPLPDVRERVRTKRKDYIHYPSILSLHCRLRRKPKWAYAMIQVALNRNGIDAQYNLAAASMAEQMGHPEDALRYAATAIAVDPENVSALAVLGVVLANQNLKKQGLFWLDRAIALDPEAQHLHDHRHRIEAAQA